MAGKRIGSLQFRQPLETNCARHLQGWGLRPSGAATRFRCAECDAAMRSDCVIDRLTPRSIPPLAKGYENAPIRLYELLHAQFGTR